VVLHRCIAGPGHLLAAAKNSFIKLDESAYIWSTAHADWFGGRLISGLTLAVSNLQAKPATNQSACATHIISAFIKFIKTVFLLQPANARPSNAPDAIPTMAISCWLNIS